MIVDLKVKTAVDPTHWNVGNFISNFVTSDLIVSYSVYTGM